MEGINARSTRTRELISGRLYSYSRPVFLRGTSKTINPVSGGLTDNSIRMLIATLQIVKDEYLRRTGKEQCSSLLVPTENIIKKLYVHLCIQEHINRICLGIHYEKNESFCSSPTFNKLIEYLKNSGKDNDLSQATNSDSDARG